MLVWNLVPRCRWWTGKRWSRGRKKKYVWDLQSLYPSPNFAGEKKSNRKRTMKITYKILMGKTQEKWQFVKLDVDRQPSGQSLRAWFFGTQWQTVLLHENRKILGHMKNYQSRSSNHNLKTSAKSLHNKWTSPDLHPKQRAPVHVSACVDIYARVKHTLTHRNQTVLVGCGWINLLITVKRKTDWWCKLPWMAING